MGPKAGVVQERPQRAGFRARKTVTNQSTKGTVGKKRQEDPRKPPSSKLNIATNHPQAAPPQRATPSGRLGLTIGGSLGPGACGMGGNTVGGLPFVLVSPNDTPLSTTRPSYNL